MASRIDDGVRVNGDDDFAGGFARAVLERRGLAAIGLVDDAHARIAAEILRGSSPVRSVEPSLTTIISRFGIIRSQRRLHGADDDVFFVVRRNQHADRRLKFGMIRRARARSFSISARSPMISARPLTSTMPATKIHAMPSAQPSEQSRRSMRRRARSSHSCVRERQHYLRARLADQLRDGTI